jgi:hypothetical protein
VLIFDFAQNGSGGFTVAMPSGFDSATINPTASAHTKLLYVYNGANTLLVSDISDLGPMLFGQELAAPATPASGFASCWFDSTDHTGVECKANNSSNVFKLVLGGADINTATGQVTNLSNVTNASLGTTGIANGAVTNSKIANSTIDLTAKVTGILPGANGGTNNGFFQVSGPAASLKTFTFPNASATIPQTILATTTAVLGTSPISGNSCASVVTVSATGVATTDTITWAPNADISAVTGYGAGSTDGLKIYPYPTADNINFKVCNGTSSSITPGAVTLNVAVYR